MEREFECGWCGKPFSSNQKTATYCSRDCVRAAQALAAMKRYTCAQCGELFLSKTSNRKYCSKPCADRSKVGEKRPETALKIAAALKGQKHTPERCSNISKAKRYEITPEMIDRIKDAWKLRYVQDNGLLIELSGLPRNNVVYYEIRNELKSEWESTKPILCLPKEVQQWAVEKMEAFKEDAGFVCRDEVCGKYGIGPKTFKRLVDAFGIPTSARKNHSVNKRTTEQPIRAILETLGFKYGTQVALGGYLYDFRVADTMIEVHGDYWHGNPAVYGNALNEMQLRAQSNDEEKIKCAEDHGYKVLTIWEKDIKENMGEVIVNIKEALCKTEQY